MTNTMWMRGVEWAAAAAADPHACESEWDRGEGIALLEAGRFWDVLSVPDRLGLLAMDLLWRPARPSPGPTLVDTAAGRVGFFLPPDPSAGWGGAGLRYATKGSWVAVPPPYRPARFLEWLVPPDGTGALHEPGALEAALRRASGTLAVLAPLCGG
ncbi:hypothetical protein J2Z21_000184 [Streptomyces griseochromogenes]|uniref:DNA primase/polymerase bifunctional N-terminal domain-containing protein n=1 Tax=Streptomyces griseochromogenes TaxID=68214 RepID=A0A1B1B1F8_9ACTN|nr:hypothetical protein [Streptomyces griseochromogenes]ANP52668.1 hypothetical protein AVL59_26825 [Streptomyces griseochromogenes]MBP2047262.1 hypothetical protein [Streptomyces griseochromogenes]